MSKYLIKFPIELVEKALQSKEDLFPEKLVYLPIQSQRFGRVKVVFTRDKVLFAYQASIDKELDAVEMEYEMPSDADWKRAGFKRDGNYMVLE